jgi:hypothetical protein
MVYVFIAIVVMSIGRNEVRYTVESRSPDKSVALEMCQGSVQGMVGASVCSGAAECRVVRGCVESK